MPAPTLTDLLEAGVAGRTVLIRSDLNVPLDGDTVTDDGRIRASLPAIRDLAEAGARVIVMAHLGRPKGEPDPAYSLRPVAARMAELLGADVALAADVTGDDARAKAAALQDGQVLLLENVRFDARETSKDDAERAALADEMAALAGEDGAYVGDAFGAVHRKHASVFDVAAQLPAYQGPLVAAELEVLTRLTESPERPYVVVLGGSKVSDKLAVIDNLLDKADMLLIGGGMLFTFLKAQGYEVGKSLVDDASIETCKKYLEQAEATSKQILLPTDVRVASEVDFDAHTVGQVDVVPVDAIPADKMGLDIGPETEKAYAAAIEQATSVFWNGPMGVFEIKGLEQGTKTVAEALTKVDGLSVVGGGDSASAVRALGFDDDQFGHISTGGGASLELMEGKELPGIAVLKENN